jgi:starch phosphorylase
VPQAIQGLAELALDLEQTRSSAWEALWSSIDPDTWRLSRNPWLILQTVSGERLEELAADPAFCSRIQRDLADQRARRAAPSWFEGVRQDAPLSCVAYFSLEFGLSEALPIYSGGLGVLAGDHLKGANDLGVPIAGVGILYQQGYFRQVLDAEGRQTELYPFNDPSDLPIQPVQTADGGRLRIPLRLPGRTIWLRVWVAQVGRIPLYLLDFNDPRNSPADRGITSDLYGGGAELRLQQEAALGVGGWLLLEALGIRPEVCHLNEGHAAFVVLARARSFMEETGVPFEVALAATRVGNVFTTHTPVAAGFDRFDRDLAERYFTVIADWMKVDRRVLLGLGRANPFDESEPFNMAYLAVRGSGTINGVSRLHGEVSRRIFAPLFARWPEAEVPVGHVTNGVHIPSWASPEMDALYCHACGPGVWRGSDSSSDQGLRALSDEVLWREQARSRRRLVDFVRDRLAVQLGAEAMGEARIAEARRILDPNALTLGFARRFASYKRPNLLLTDPERLARLLRDGQRPVQILVAGKAHPRDVEGKAMIAEWVRFVRRPELRARAVFLSDYDLLLAEELVEGVDLWINTPRRPWEASGTSGMKVAVNGGLNLSELDGWWAEAYAPELGWALGDGKEHDGDPEWDRQEAEMLYELLEREVVPCFYDRDEYGIPINWVRRMSESLAQLAPQYSSSRMVREYTEQAYLPSAIAVRRRTADQGKQAALIESWRRQIEAYWPTVHIASTSREHVGEEYRVLADVYLGDLALGDVRVQVYADQRAEAPHCCVDMVPLGDLTGGAHAYQFEARVPADRPEVEYTVRVIAHHPDALVPLEESRVLWER